MIKLNFSDFKTGLSDYLDDVELNNQVIVVDRGHGKAFVLMPFSEYSSIHVKFYLTKSKTNADWLKESIDQVNNGNIVQIESDNL